MQDLITERGFRTLDTEVQKMDTVRRELSTKNVKEKQEDEELSLIDVTLKQLIDIEILKNGDCWNKIFYKKK